MNTDNMAISGETIDFGPCAFMDTYDPNTVFSSIDNFGRYAYSNQSQIAHWNLIQLAEAILPIIDPTLERAVEIARNILEEFPEIYKNYWQINMGRKIGLLSSEPNDDSLIKSLLDLMHQSNTDFTLTFRQLCDEPLRDHNGGAARKLFKDPSQYDIWAQNWRMRLNREKSDPHHCAELMRRNNPAFIPRNHLVEEVLSAAIDNDDFRPFEQMLNVLMAPYSEPTGSSKYTDPPGPSGQIYQTFCGT